jgi:hypothetical protein
VLDDFPGDARHFYRAPCEHILVASEEVDDLAFLFEVQTGPNLHGFCRVPRVDLHGLGILVRLESARCWGRGWAERLGEHLEAKIPEFHYGNSSGG